MNVCDCFKTRKLRNGKRNVGRKAGHVHTVRAGFIINDPRRFKNISLKNDARPISHYLDTKKNHPKKDPKLRYFSKFKIKIKIVSKNFF
jgi:hypothetical protein